MPNSTVAEARAAGLNGRTSWYDIRRIWYSGEKYSVVCEECFHQSLTSDCV